MFARYGDIWPRPASGHFGALIFSFVALTLSGCESMPNSFENTASSSLNLAAPEFAGVTPQVKMREVFCSLQEVATWTGRTGVTQIFLIAADPGCAMSDHNETTENWFERWNWLKAGKIEREKRYILVHAPLGPIWVNFFRRDDRPCITFLHSFGESGSAIETSTKMIAGYYCSSPGTELSEKDAESFVKSISVRDTPLPIALKSRPRIHSTRLAKARQGDLAAMHSIADGNGPIDQRQYWLCRAANGGHAIGQYNMGYKLEKGIAPVAEDHVQASMWYRLSHSNGYQAGATAQQRLAEKLTSDQNARAERLAAEWKPGQCDEELSKKF